MKDACQDLMWVTWSEDPWRFLISFFADDMLIFCEADLEQILILRMILIWFEAVSGLKINLGKSELVPVGVVHNIDLFLIVLGCK